MSVFTYLAPETLRFSLSENGVLTLEQEGKDMGRVQITRLFPFQSPEEMLSVSIEEDEGVKELGIIKSLDLLPEGQRQIVQDYLRYKYFIPSIQKVGKIEEKLGYVYMDVTTVLGGKTICIADVTTNLRLVRGKTITIIDVQGNRYCIEDIDSLNRESRQKIEMYI